MIKILKLFFALLFGAVLVTLALSVTATYFLGEQAFKFFLARELTQLMGFHTEIGELHYRYPYSFKATHVKIYNPEGFENPVFAAASDLRFQLDLPALYRLEKFHFFEIELHLSEINIEKKPDGVSNYGLFKAVGSKLPKDTQAVVPAPMPFWVDRLELEIDSVSYHDRTGVLPKKIVDIKYEKKTMENIRDAREMIRAITAEVKGQAKKEKWGSMTPFYVEKSITKAAATGGDVLKGTTDAVAEGGKSMFSGGKKVVKKTGEIAPAVFTQTAEDVANGVKRVTKEPLEGLGGLLGISDEEKKKEQNNQPKAAEKKNLQTDAA